MNEQAPAPFRRIVETIQAGSTFNPPEPAVQRLECGHFKETWGTRLERLGRKKRRCHECAARRPVEP